MSPRVLLLLSAILAIPLAAASGSFPPEDAPRVELGERTLAHYVRVDDSEPRHVAATNVTPGAEHELFFAVTKENLTENVTVVVNVSFPEAGIENGTITIPLPREDVPLSDVWRMGSLTFAVPMNATGEIVYEFRAEAWADRVNTTVAIANVTGTGSVVVQDAEAPVPVPTIPRTWLLAGLAVLVIGGGAGVVALRQRSVRRRMNEGPRRSQVMRDMDLEHKLERARTKDPEAAVVIQQEIRQAEQVREKRRELQILEAKRADALKTIDLLKKRHETGGLSKHQYENMVAKKQQDLARIDAEIAEMERQDAGSAA